MHHGAGPGLTSTAFPIVPYTALYFSRSKRKFRLNHVTREQQEIDNSLKVLINREIGNLETRGLWQSKHR